MVRGIDAALDRVRQPIRQSPSSCWTARANAASAPAATSARSTRARASGGDLGATFWREEYVAQRADREIPQALRRTHGRHRDGRRRRRYRRHGSHRVVTERTARDARGRASASSPTSAAPGCCRASPGEIGTYFGADRPDHARRPTRSTRGSPTHVVPAAKWPELRDALTKVRQGVTAADVALINGRDRRDRRSGRRERAGDRRTVRLDTRGRHLCRAASATVAESRGRRRRRSRKIADRVMVVTLKLLRLARDRVEPATECLVREYRAALEVFRSDDFAKASAPR